MPYNFAAESFHTKKLCSRLSARKAPFFIWKMEKFAFEATFWGLGATYDVHLRLIGKLVGDFLIVIIRQPDSVGTALSFTAVLFTNA